MGGSQGTLGIYGANDLTGGECCLLPPQCTWGAARLGLGGKSGTSPRGWVEVLLLCVALGAGLSLECVGEMDSSWGLPSPHTDLQTRGGGGQASSRSHLCTFVSELPSKGGAPG